MFGEVDLHIQNRAYELQALDMELMEENVANVAQSPMWLMWLILTSRKRRG